MKQFWLALGLLLAMLGATWGNAVYMDDLAGTVTQGLNAAQEMALRGAWDQAEEVTRQCFGQWNDHHAYLHIVSRHNDTDEILVSFRAVLQYLALEEVDQYAAENRELVTHITLLAEMEQPDWLYVL
jgi:hypothetical protein